MVPRSYVRWLIAVALLCGTAQPALADGVPMDGWGTFFILAGLVIVGGLVMVIVLLRWLVIAFRTRNEGREEPAVPRARVVQERDQQP